MINQFNDCLYYYNFFRVNVVQLVWSYRFIGATQFL